MEGGFAYECIYILKNGELIDGQDACFSFTKEGGTENVQVISYGTLNAIEKKKSKGINLTIVDNKKPYQFEWDGLQQNGFIQTVNISAEPNKSIFNRKATYTIWSEHADGDASIFTILQQ